MERGREGNEKKGEETNDGEDRRGMMEERRKEEGERKEN